MVIPIELQFSILVFSLVAGIATGFLFDIYRVFRGFNTIKVIKIIEDILFWILCSILIFILLLYTDYAFVTPYVYLGMIIGVMFYLKFISKLFLKMQHRIIKNTSQTARIIFKYILYPFKLILSNKYKKK